MTIFNKDIPLTNNYVFRSLTSEGTHPEVCGWVEKDYTIVKGSYGFYRTDNAMEAAKIAARNLGESVIE